MTSEKIYPPIEDLELVEDERYLLSDIEVDTLGLVGRGAIGLDFFLSKSNEGGDGMTVSDLDVLKEAYNYKDGNDSVAPSLLEKLGFNRLVELITKGLEVEEAAIEDEENEDQNQGGDNTTLVEEESDNGGTMSNVKDEDVAATGAVPDYTTPHTEALEKANVEIETLKASLEKSQETAQEELKALRSEVEKANAIAAQEREARRYAAHVQKAEGFDSLPVDSRELADFTLYLEKADEKANVEKAADAEDRQDRLAWFNALLSSLNEQVEKGELFAEKGTSQGTDVNSTGADVIVSKAEEAVKEGKFSDLREALLSLSQDEAYAYLEKARSGQAAQ